MKQDIEGLKSKVRELIEHHIMDYDSSFGEIIVECIDEDVQVFEVEFKNERPYAVITNNITIRVVTQERLDQLSLSLPAQKIRNYEEFEIEHGEDCWYEFGKYHNKVLFWIEALWQTNN